MLLLPTHVPLSTVTLPEAKVLRERAAAARKLADSVRQALPAARGEGRRRGTDQVRGSLSGVVWDDVVWCGRAWRGAWRVEQDDVSWVAGSAHLS